MVWYYIGVCNITEHYMTIWRYEIPLLLLKNILNTWREIPYLCATMYYPLSLLIFLFCIVEGLLRSTYPKKGKVGWVASQEDCGIPNQW